MPRTLAKAALVSTLVLAPALACSDQSPAPTDSLDRIELATGITAYASDGALIVRNDSTVELRVGILELELARTSLALWCFGAATCGDAIEPGAELSVPLASITGYTPSSSEVLVHYWDPKAVDAEGVAEVKKFSVGLREN